MAYLRRKMDEELMRWKQRDHLPLIVCGARQVGKTASILHFAKAAYASVVYVNFALEPKYKRIASEGYSVEGIVRELTLLNEAFSFRPGKTLIVFDEIQDYPEIATSLKSFREDGRFDVIASGSLLGVQYHRIPSFAVGNQEFLTMSSMDFEEFLWAMGRDEAFVERMLEPMVSGIPYTETEWKVYQDAFLTYCSVGGMPAIVSRYVEQRHFEGIVAQQRVLVESYGADARKYCEGLDQARIVDVYQSVPAQLAKENKKFQFSNIARGARARAYEGCVQWLEDAGLVVRCGCLGALELPLKGNARRDCYKLYVPDTGLLLAMLDAESADDFRLHRNLHTYRGGIVENIVAEAFYKARKELYYFKRENATMELDFLLRTRDALVPVEVKSTNNKAKSLSQAIANEAYPDVRFGIKLVLGNVGHDGNVFTFPLFCAFLVPRFLETMK